MGQKQFLLAIMGGGLFCSRVYVIKIRLGYGVHGFQSAVHLPLQQSGACFYTLWHDGPLE